MHIKIRLKKLYVLEQLEEKKLRLKIGDFCFFIELSSKTTTIFFLKLIQGIKENYLVNLINKYEPKKEELIGLLRSLHDHCCFDYAFYKNDSQKKAVFTISPKTPAIVLSDLANENFTKLKVDDCEVSKFTYLRWIGSAQWLENPLANLSILLSNINLIDLCLSSKRSHHTKVNRHLDYLKCILLREKFIYPVNQVEKLSSKIWNFHDLLFHKYSRMQEFPYPPNFGASFPFKDLEGQTPLMKAPMSDIKIALEKPHLDDLSASDPFLSCVLEKRKTRRQHGQKPINKKQLGELLYRVFHITHQETINNRTVVHHVYPNAGGINEFEIYLLAHNCQNLNRDIYQYDYAQSNLFALNANQLELDEMLKLAACAWNNKNYPQVLIILSSKFPKIFWKYEGIGYRNSLVNAGAIVQTIYLVGEAMNLAVSCLGYGCSDLFSKIIQSNPLEETSLIELAIGNRKI